MKMVLGLLAAVLVFLGLRYAVNDWFRNRAVPAMTASGNQCLVMAGSTTREQDGATYIVGSFRNECDRKFSQVTISFKLERSSGAMQSLPEAVVTAYTRDVQPGETRQFKSTMPVSRNAIFRFDAISGF